MKPRQGRRKKKQSRAGDVAAHNHLLRWSKLICARFKMDNLHLTTQPVVGLQGAVKAIVGAVEGNDVGLKRMEKKLDVQASRMGELETTLANLVDVADDRANVLERDLGSQAGNLEDLR